MTIHKFPVALALYIKYCRIHNTQALNEVYNQEEDYTAQAQRHILDSLNEKTAHNRDSSLISASAAYKKARNDLYSSLCDESLQLLKLQSSFEDKLKSHGFVGLSVHDTCKKLLEMNEIKHAEKIKNDFRMPDRRYWWLRIECYANKNNWEDLEKFSKLKKSPIGYAPFVDVCLQRRNREEALKYLPKVSDEIKVKYYIKAQYYEQAADVAFEQKDMQALLQVQSKVGPQSNLYEKINGFISQLGTKKSFFENKA